MNSILITGCNRGLGLGLVNKLVNHSNPPQHIIATCRDKEKAEELRNIAEKHNNINIIEIGNSREINTFFMTQQSYVSIAWKRRNLNEFDRYEHVLKQVQDIVEENGLNVLFNNAAVAGKFTRLGLVKADALSDAFTTNTIAPIMLTKTLMPLLKKAASKNSDVAMGVSRACVINMSSYLGSLTLNTDGGYFPYRCSKAALNMATRSMCADFKNDGIMAVSFHPGWVKTAMGGSKAPMEVETSVTDLVNLMYNLREEHNGKFLAHDGTELSW